MVIAVSRSGTTLEQGDPLLSSDKLMTGVSSRVGKRFSSRNYDSSPGISKLAATTVAGQGKGSSDSGGSTIGSLICVDKILNVRDRENVIGRSICIVSADTSSTSKPHECLMPPPLS